MEGLALILPQEDSNSKIHGGVTEIEANNGGMMLVSPATMAVPEVSGDPPIVTDEVVATIAADVAEETQKKTTNKRREHPIKVSNTKNPFVFYLNLAKRHIKQHNRVELSALGMAIPTVVTIAENLKRIGLAVEKSIKMSSVESMDSETGRLVQKAKIEIMMEKAGKPEDPTNCAVATISKATSLLAVKSI
ncbi:Uncharacterized protein At2g34160 [Linum grandiflorum]